MRTLSLCAASMLLAAISHGAIIYSDFSSPPTEYSSSGDVIENNRSYAESFVASGNFTFTEVDVAVSSIDTDQPLTVSLVADSGSDSPGSTVLESFNFASVTSTPEIVAGDSTLFPSLTAGQTYWIVLSTSGAGDYGWSDNNSGAVGIAVNIGSGWNVYPTDTSLAFDVQGNAETPEPATAGLIGMMLAAGGLVRRCSKK